LKEFALRKKVLVIEDEKIDALRIGRAINAQFPEVSLELITTGEQALDWLHRFRGDSVSLVLMDLSVPRMHGLELLVEFKRSDLVKDVPIVVLSGNEDPEAIRLAYGAGASAYVVKPATAAQMSAALTSTLEFWLNVNRVSVATRVAET
jgi:chemotaxis family two-component system response regulator Rcp1